MPVTAGDGTTHAEPRRAARRIGSAAPSLVRAHRAVRSFRSVTGVRRPILELRGRESSKTTRKSDRAARAVTHMFARLRRSVAELARLAECKRVGPFMLRPRYVMRRLSSTHLLPARPVKAVATRIAAPASPFVLGILAGFVGAAAVGTAECVGGDGADAASDAEMMSTTATCSSNPLTAPRANNDVRSVGGGKTAGDESFFPWKKSAKDELAKVAAARAEAEAQYITAVSAALPPHKRARLTKLLSDKRMSPGWEGDRDPLTVPAERMEARNKPHVFCAPLLRRRAGQPGRGAIDNKHSNGKRSSTHLLGECSYRFKVNVHIDARTR